ncbi:hypothetical protein ACOAOT_22205 [Lacrimispora sp. AGF001]|uniref:hypothetical protein n=1 Tax=Lacrimispora sp. AGF001 TaxID=3401631 RepID=UPI003B428CBD
MDRLQAVKVLEKYKGVSRLLGLQEDESVLDDLVNFITENYTKSFTSDNDMKKSKFGDKDFQAITANDDIDLSIYDIDEQILLNRENLWDFWYSLDDDKKNKFTIFELNIILYFISNQYNKYQKKDKKRIISIINNVVKDKRMDNSYSNIIV